MIWRRYWWTYLLPYHYILILIFLFSKNLCVKQVQHLPSLLFVYTSAVALIHYSFDFHWKRDLVFVWSSTKQTYSFTSEEHDFSPGILCSSTTPVLLTTLQYFILGHSVICDLFDIQVFRLIKQSFLPSSKNLRLTSECPSIRPQSLHDDRSIQCLTFW